MVHYMKHYLYVHMSKDEKYFLKKYHHMLAEKFLCRKFAWEYQQRAHHYFYGRTFKNLKKMLFLNDSLYFSNGEM